MTLSLYQIFFYIERATELSNSAMCGTYTGEKIVFITVMADEKRDKTERSNNYH